MEKTVTNNTVEKVSNIIIEKIEQKTMKDCEADIYDHLCNYSLFFSDDLYRIIKENEDIGLSHIDAMSEVVGSYMTLENLLWDIVNDIMKEEIIAKLKEKGYAEEL